MSNERGDDFSMRSPRSKCREIQPGWLKIYQSSSPSLSPARNDFSGRAPSFLTALYVHALVTLKCRGSIFARLVQFPITRTLLVLEKARWSLSIAIHSARVIPFFSLLSISISLCRARTSSRASFVSSNRDRECIERMLLCLLAYKYPGRVYRQKRRIILEEFLVSSFLFFLSFLINK